MAGKVALNWVDDNQEFLNDISDKIWNYAEIGLLENKSAALLTGELEKAGFEVERGVAGMPTAFVATWGSGSPRIGFLGEYDALPHLSQKVSTKKEPLIPDAPGHGCGHNIFGTAVLGAVLALQAEMKKDNLPGTIIYFGCPAEETLTGKIFMSRDGVFKNLDSVFTWHPLSFNTVSAASTLAMNSARFTFHGRSSHASVDPHEGRSALDAVELMNVGANFLREHVIPEARIHYVITNGGGEPNIVPPHAQVWYYVRAPKREIVEEIFGRLKKIAEGACLMTETTHEMKILTGTHNFLSNSVLVKMLHECMQKIGPQKWSDEEIQFAKDLTATFTPGSKEAQILSEGLPEEYFDKYLDDTICPILGWGKTGTASNDNGDVSWQAPAASVSVCCHPIGCPGHSWQFTASAGSTIAHKGLALAAKTLAMGGSQLLRNPELVEQAKAEFAKTMEKRTYKVAISDDAKPPLDQFEF